MSSKKSLWAVFLVTFLCAALGGTLLYYQAIQKQSRDSPALQNNAPRPPSAAGTGEDTGNNLSPGGTGSDGNTPGSPNPGSGDDKSGSGPASGTPGHSVRGETDPRNTTGADIEGKPGETEAAPGSPPPANDPAEPANPRQPAGDDTLRGQIELNYISQLQTIASGYESRLNALAAAAAKEYKAAIEADPGADITPIAGRYYAEGKALEAECDARVYPLLEAFEGELRANSFPIDKAVQARETYEARKSARAGELISVSP